MAGTGEVDVGQFSQLLQNVSIIHRGVAIGKLDVTPAYALLVFGYRSTSSLGTLLQTLSTSATAWVMMLPTSVIAGRTGRSQLAA